MRKPSRTTLKRKADKIWSEIILSKGACEICGSKRYLNPHHIEGRRNLTLRHDLRNGACLCSGCHTMRVNSAHQSPLWFQDWMMKNRREDLNYLMLKRMELSTKIDYEEIIKQLLVSKLQLGL